MVNDLSIYTLGELSRKIQRKLELAEKQEPVKRNQHKIMEWLRERDALDHAIEVLKIDQLNPID